MEKEFWDERWELGEIGFHQQEVHPLLRRHFAKLQLPPAGTVLVPLCGKSLDLPWLAEQGCRVVGVELSVVAVTAFFAENGLEPVRTRLGPFERYSCGAIEVFCGDFFALTPELLGPVDAVYDRAALVALPPAMRKGYAEHLVTLMPTGCRTLCISYEYDPTQMAGPPFAVPRGEVEGLFTGTCDVSLIYEEDALETPAHLGLKKRSLTWLRGMAWLIYRR